MIHLTEHCLFCEQEAQGEGYADEIRMIFPHGIEVVGPDAEADSARRLLQDAYEDR